MKHNKDTNVVSCPPCGENVGLPTKRWFLNKDTFLITPHRPYGALPPQVGKSTARAFTLIELLVVVLIIGILAAVAVPQYQKAVQRSQFATVKNLVKSISDAQETYYLANGIYSDDLSELDIDMPNNTVTVEYDEEDEQDIIASKRTRHYQWGSCSSSMGQTLCRYYFPTFNIQYQIANPHSGANYNGTSYAGKIICVAEGTKDSASPQAKFCQTETGKTEADLSSPSWLMYFYN